MARDCMAPRMIHEGERIFLRMAQSGCGAGCSYCYIDKPKEPAQYFPDSQIDKWVAEVREVSPNSIVAIGCDTDPFITPQAIDIALRYLEALESVDSHVQISTKFAVPKRVAEKLDSWAGGSRPIVFTSITTIEKASVVEPHAATIEQRLKNFSIERVQWKSCALVKPILHLASEDLDDLCQRLIKYRPDCIVLGARYRRARLDRNDQRPHPFAKGWEGSLKQDEVTPFLERLAEAGIPIFHNTECVVDYFNQTGHGQRISQNYPDLCTECGRCSKLEDER